MQFVQLTDGSRLAYEGECTGRQGTPVVFVHGAGGSRHKWLTQVNAVSKAFPSSPVIALDLPGHGDSPGDAASDMAINADVVYRALEALFPGQAVIVVGHSMGGTIGQELALRYPDKLKALVLVTTGARLKVDPAYLEKLKAGERDPERAKYAFSPATGEAVRKTVQAQEVLSPVASAYKDFLACNAFDRREDVGAIRAPTLVIGGEDDRTTPPKFSVFLAEKIPQAQLVLVPQAGHYVMFEQPEALLQAMLPFLKQWV